MKFDSKASLYHNRADIQRVVADWCSEWIGLDCSPYSGLELGAGTGHFTRHLALRGFRNLAATDLSNSMLREGRGRLPAVDWERLDAWNGDGRKVDRIYSCSLLQWAKDPVSVLKNWRRMLSPEGQILSSMFVSGSLREFEQVDGRFAALDWRSPDEWRETFERAGFRVSRWDTRSDRASFRNAREALRSIHDIGASGEKRMSASEMRRFLGQLDRGPDTPFEISWESMRIECVVRD